MSYVNTVLISAGFLVTLITGVLGYRAATRRLADIHVLVNSRLASVTARVDQLIAVLKRHGIDVPDDPGQAVATPQPPQQPDEAGPRGGGDEGSGKEQGAQYGEHSR